LGRKYRHRKPEQPEKNQNSPANYQPIYSGTNHENLHYTMG